MDRLTDADTLVELLGDWTTVRGPLYRKLASAVATCIEAGDLRAGQRLPSERDLAKLLTVSRATVVAAYDELRGSGLVDSLRGSGTRVAARVRARSSGADGRVPGGRATSIFQRLVDGPGEVISLAMAIEPAAPELAEAIRELTGGDDLDELMADVGYHPRGYPPLRQAVAQHYAELWLPTTADQVLVTTGAQQVLGLVAQMYLRPGCTVVVESPSWPGCLDVFRAAGARLVGVPLDEEGVRPDLLAKAFADEKPVLAYVMPTFHNPTGTLMSTSRRQRVAELAARFDVPILEDNAYTGFVSRDGVSALSPIGAFARGNAEILTVGSMAKAVWGGLRIGWVRAPGAIIERLARYKVRADLGSPILDQAITARLLPKLSDIAGARGDVLRLRLDHLQNLLGEHLPSWRWRSPDGGSALWIELPETSAQIFAQVALRHGVELVPGSATDPSGGHDNHVRLPFTLPTEVLTELVRRLSSAWTDLRRHGPVDDEPEPTV
ncbi:PLP-dependent aminotransferase family protein [Actinokineospora sp. HUAS TT18]|uniref:aminotransferase-like domain-containing protein n=1 Tax=Actinokineospora sp. HUAS TT18 TaxID=3447451 RepID=UPI003F520E7D